MGEILRELEKHIVDVAEKVNARVDNGDFGNTKDWEVKAITIVTGRSKSEDQQFHTVVHTEDMSVPEIVGILELVKIGIAAEALSDEHE